MAETLVSRNVDVNTIAAEPPIRTNGIRFFKVDYLFSFSWIQPIEFQHGNVFRGILADNIDLIRSIMESVKGLSSRLSGRTILLP